MRLSMRMSFFVGVVLGADGAVYNRPLYFSMASVKYVLFKFTPVCDSRNQSPPNDAAPVSSVEARTVTPVRAVSLSMIYFQSGFE